VERARVPLLSCLIVVSRSSLWENLKKEKPTPSWQRGGINAALGTMDSADSWQLHVADTIKEGGGLNNPSAVAFLCKHAPQAIEELVKWGTPFHRQKNKALTQRFFGAATYRRACFVGDQTGRAILNTLIDQAIKRKIPMIDEIYIFALLQHKGRVNGALGRDKKSGEIIAFQAKMVVLATGGYASMFKQSSSHAWENNGDGIKLAYDLHAQFMDMEMLQFHPTGMVYPKEAEGTLVTEAVRGEGGILTNAKGERFMKRYDAQWMELAARDIVARANYMEILADRGTPHKGVWLDISHRSREHILDRLPQMHQQFKQYNHIDISKEKMEVAPTAHYSMGGICVKHTTGETTVPHLYAIGEVTAGVHGGNRLGGNSLAEIMVFGKSTGKAIADTIKDISWSPLEISQIKDRENKLQKMISNKGRDPIIVKRELQNLMWHHASVIREEKTMQEGLQKLQAFKKTVLHTGNTMKMNERLMAALDIINMLPTCEMILLSALHRKESRASHYRSDYPKMDSEWQKNILCTPTKKGIQLTSRKVAPIPLHIQKLMDTRELKFKYDRHLSE